MRQTLATSRFQIQTKTQFTIISIMLTLISISTIIGKIKNEQGTEVTIQQSSLALSHNVISLENCSSDDDCTVCPSLPPKSNHDQ